MNGRVGVWFFRVSLPFSFLSACNTSLENFLELFRASTFTSCVRDRSNGLLTSLASLLKEQFPPSTASFPVPGSPNLPRRFSVSSSFTLLLLPSQATRRHHTRQFPFR
ncbi:hypothetical protein BDY24DRAFT_390699, partial [Mrakia frigida]|uniref:uncharacterized protein n=1 Tax=Mrakia frigida TaxID=29902 RepID=UPI003FCC11FB